MTSTDRKVMRGDLALAVGVLALTLITLLGAQRSQLAYLPWGLALTVVACALLLWRRSYPLAIFALTALASDVYYTAGFPDTALALTMAVALYTLATRRTWRISLIAAVCAVLAFIAAAALVTPWHLAGEIDLRILTGVGLAFAVCITTGEVVKARQLAADNAEQRAVQSARAAEEQATRRVTEERMRIARELHDVLAHELSLINVQASAALHRPEPDTVEPTLRAIKQASHSALTELRSVLGILRKADEATTPVPSLTRVDELVDSARASGLTVTVRGASQGLDTAVSATGYRIVQESLTNVVRHANAAGAIVEIQTSGKTLVLTVTDDGTAREDHAATAREREGNGLRGMRERVCAVGGSLSAGPCRGGGFQVRAVLPRSIGNGGSA